MPSTPSPSATSTIAAKIPRSVADRLREEAHRADRTLSGQIRKVLREWATGEPPEHATAATQRPGA
jgi:hypothetical protein